MAIKTYLYPVGSYLENKKVTKKSVELRVNEGQAFRGFIERNDNGKETLYVVFFRPTVFIATGEPTIAYTVDINDDFEVEGHGADFKSAYNGILRQIRKQEELLKLAKY